jgi:hypothetical protein
MVRSARLLLAAALLLGFASGCEKEIEPNPRLRISIFGWGPEDPFNPDQLGFFQGMPAYNGATTVRVSVTDPVRNVILGQQVAPLMGRRVTLPDVSFGAGLRVELEVLDSLNQVLASGSTPRLGLEQGGAFRPLRMWITPANAFAPVGSLVSNAQGQRSLEQSRFDYRGFVPAEGRPFWLGRVGHAVAPTSDGKVLIIGGADIIPGAALDAVPNLRQSYNDVQIFDPETGYFTDIGYDERLGIVRPPGQDRLQEGRAWATITPVGDDKFLVVGGYSRDESGSFPNDNIELIDLRAPEGDRVKLLQNESGTSLVKLRTPRGFHTAVYRAQANQVIVIGGVGASSTDVLSSVEIIDLNTNRIIAGDAVRMGTARTGHASLLLETGKIWVIGGRNADGALASTELISLSELAVTSEAGPSMRQARFDFGVAPVGQANSVVVVGGFTNTEGAVTGSYELGLLTREMFETFRNSDLAVARGGLSLVRLPHSADLVVLGGRDASGEAVDRAERMSFGGLGLGAPYEIISDGVGIMYVKRYGAQPTLMTNGRILITGGLGLVDGQQLALDNAELYNPRDPVAGGVFIQR